MYFFPFFMVFIGKWQRGIARNSISNRVVRDVVLRSEFLLKVVYCRGVVLIVPVSVAEDPVVVGCIFPCLIEVVCHVGPFDSSCFCAFPLRDSSHGSVRVAL